MKSKKKQKCVKFIVERETKIFFVLFLVFVLIRSSKAVNFELQANSLRGDWTDIEINSDEQLPVPEPILVNSGESDEGIHQRKSDVEIFKYFDDILKNPVYPTRD